MVYRKLVIITRDDQNLSILEIWSTWITKHVNGTLTSQVTPVKHDTEKLKFTAKIKIHGHNWGQVFNCYARFSFLSNQTIISWDYKFNVWPWKLSLKNAMAKVKIHGHIRGLAFDWYVFYFFFLHWCLDHFFLRHQCFPLLTIGVRWL